MPTATRRAFVGAAVAAAGMKGALARERSDDSVLFVLVHGTGHGGWCWKFVRDILHERGHRVYTPTLTGCGERSHLLHPDIGLDMHITDIVNVLEWEELENVVLVGHSYGGLVISGVADRAKERLRHLIYLDAIIPRDGDSLLTARRDISVEEMRANEEQLRRIAPDGNYVVGFFRGDVRDSTGARRHCGMGGTAHYSTSDQELAGPGQIRERRRGRRALHLY